MKFVPRWHLAAHKEDVEMEMLAQVPANETECVGFAEVPHPEGGTQTVAVVRHMMYTTRTRAELADEHAGRGRFWWCKPSAWIPEALRLWPQKV